MDEVATKEELRPVKKQLVGLVLLVIDCECRHLPRNNLNYRERICLETTRLPS